MQKPSLQNIIRQIYDNVMTYGRFTTDLQENEIYKKSYEKVTRNIRQSYDKMYDSSLAVVQQHQACVQ